MKPAQLIVFDGTCILCNRFIQFVLKKDKNAHFYFSSYQGLPAEIDQRGLKIAKEDSISYLRHTKWHQRSAAVLFIYQDLFGKLHYTQLAWLLPRFLRDLLYDIIALNRYKWFGKKDSCMMPDPLFKTRFIG